MGCAFPLPTLALAGIKPPPLRLPTLPGLPNFGWAPDLGLPAIAAALSLASVAPPPLRLPTLPGLPSYAWAVGLGITLPDAPAFLASITPPSLSLPSLPATFQVPCPFDVVR